MKHFIKAMQDLATSALPLLLDPRSLGRMADVGGPLPNIEMRVLRKGIFFRVLAEFRGWTLERHVVTHLCRIVDPNNVRRAWGGERAMRALFSQLVNPSAERS
jgi:hypothetical protein